MGGEADRPLVCLGEALVDLICPEPVDDPAEATNYEVRFGGALANVAVAATRAGAAAALAGGCGDDEWGHFLRADLEGEGVDLRFHSLLPGIGTPFAFATLDRGREPHFRIHGEGIEQGIATLSGREREVVEGAGAVVIGSNTLVGELGRAVTLAVVDAATRGEVPVLFDPNLRPGRWRDLDHARDLCREMAAVTTVLKCNLGEARWLTGGDGDAVHVAAELLELGPRLIVVTAGTEPAVARGAGEAEVEPPAVEMVSPLGAGDAFMGTLAAGLAASGWELSDVGTAMEAAAAAGAEACTRLGAFS